MTSMRAGVLLVVVAGAASGLGCRRASEARAASATRAPSDPDAPSEAPASAPPLPRPPPIEPVYPATLDGAPDPLAEQLCSALHTLPETRRAACCAAPAAVELAGECTRVLTLALRARAVRLDAADVDACAAAMARALDGCDWVGPFPVAPPAACAGIVRGAVAAGERCRSSLECAGGLRCRGAGPTQPGRCSAALDDGALCGLAVDTLASYTRQEAVDREHRECAGYCARHRCHRAVARGAACTLSSQCVDGDHCAAGRCAGAPFAAVGEPCTGADCAPGSRCVQHRCLVPRGDGATCGSDFECRGGCVRAPGAVDARCAPRCDLR
jgi:hypothetical protein